MGASAPYLYESRPASGLPSNDFNPRAYTQGYAASVAASSKSRPKSMGPLIDFNQHPDSYMIVSYGQDNHEPLPNGTKKTIVVTRWVQFGLRLLQLLGAVGLLFCVICVKGAAPTQSWMLRVPVSIL